MNLDLNPTRFDKINDNLLALKGWACRGQGVIDDAHRLDEVCLMLTKIAEETLLYSRTPEEQGRKWRWWK